MLGHLPSSPGSHLYEITESVIALKVDIIIDELWFNAIQKTRTCWFLKGNNVLCSYELTILAIRLCYSFRSGSTWPIIRLCSTISKNLSPFLALPFGYNFSEKEVSMFVQALAALLWRIVSSLLAHKGGWGFSFAFHGATLIWSAFIDNCVRNWTE